MTQSLYQEKANVRGNIMAKPGPAKGSKKSAAHRKKIGKSLIGDKNPKYKDGRRSYRRIAGAKSGDVVMHKNGDRNDNRPSNLKISKGKKAGANSTSEHERSKMTIKERGAGRKKGSKNKKKQKMSINIKTYKLFGTKK